MAFSTVRTPENIAPEVCVCVWRGGELGEGMEWCRTAPKVDAGVWGRGGGRMAKGSQGVGGWCRGAAGKGMVAGRPCPDNIAPNA